LSFCPFSFGHCIVCSSLIYDSDYHFGIFKLFLSVVAVEGGMWIGQQLTYSNQLMWIDNID
jgi:hypothetical protein